MPSNEHPERRLIHEPGKTPGAAEGEESYRSPRPDVGRTPGSAEGEPESKPRREPVKEQEPARR